MVSTNMTYMDKIRVKLQSKLFNQIAKSVTFIKITQPTYNTRGELESYLQSTSSLSIVPYNLIEESRSYQPFGVLNAGQFDAAVPYGTDINKEDQIVMESVTYSIVNVDPNYLPDNVVTIIRLERVN